MAHKLAAGPIADLASALTLTVGYVDYVGISTSRQERSSRQPFTILYFYIVSSHTRGATNMMALNSRANQPSDFCDVCLKVRNRSSALLQSVVAPHGR